MIKQKLLNCFDGGGAYSTFLYSGQHKAVTGIHEYRSDLILYFLLTDTMDCGT